MHKRDQTLLNVLHGQSMRRKPVWLMRQAGRYLPEYRELRSKAEDFVKFCLSPEMATEATLQPLRRFDLDAAILFADILLVPHALGQGLAFTAGEGPVLEPVTTEQDLCRLALDPAKIEPVFETIARVKPALSPAMTLLGFSGGLWTVACYMIQGRAKEGFARALALTETYPAFMDALFAILGQATKAYLLGQVRAGVDAIQIFESHAGLLTGEAFRRWVIQPTQELVSALKQESPDLKIIGFPRGARLADWQAYAAETGIDAIGVDQHVALVKAREKAPQDMILQGNLDPALLLEGGAAMRREAEKICETFPERHIFNLGHGVLPQTPPEHVADLITHIRRCEA